MTSDKKQKPWLDRFQTTLRVGFFLAFRQVIRSNKWTTALIIFVMMLTFLNLVVVSGILVGLIEGATQAVKGRYIGDLAISSLIDKPYIEQSPSIIKVVENMEGVEAVTARYAESGKIESDYKKSKKASELSKQVGTIISGIDPEKEDRVTGISKLLVEGEYLEKDDYDQVLIGAFLLTKYLQFESPGFPTLDNVEIGSKVRVSVNGIMREVTVKGILKSKVDEVDRRVFFTDTQFQRMIGRSDNNVDEIAVKLKPKVDPVLIKNQLVARGFDKYARIQTFEEGQPKFLKDIKETFNMLGNAISAIGVVVASITIFIVIFINAITRRKFIGILKGIGIDGASIEFAYVIQSLFYAVIGVFLGVIFVFLFLQPYIAAHPINFPFSDGILVATAFGTTVRALVLFVATLIAGYIPAKIVVKQNTLDAILGR